MIVRNRKTGREYEITENDWQKLVQSQSHRLFEIIKKGENVKAKLPIPKEIEEYQKDPKRLKIDKSEK